MRRWMHRCDAFCGWTRSFGVGFCPDSPEAVNLHSTRIKHLLQTCNTGQELAQKQLGSAHWEQQRRAK